MGDLSENADYHKAKEDQAFLEGRIQEIEYLLRNATIIGKERLIGEGGSGSPRDDPGGWFSSGNVSHCGRQGSRSPQRKDLQ